jgi:hypothetical protein
VAASAFVRPSGSAGWARVEGSPADGGFRFEVPAALVPADGFVYWLGFTTRDGAQIDYPPGGEAAALRVLTTAGLPELAVPEGFAWSRRRRPDGVAVRLPYGSADGRVGRTGGRTGEDVSGPSSFDVASDGAIWVVDWVNRRIQVFGATGRYRRSLALPEGRPMDLAVRPDGGAYLASLGTGAEVLQLDAAGHEVGRYPVAFGVSARVGVTPQGPKVNVGPGQWASVSLRDGVPLGALDQSRTTTPSVPLADGALGVTGPLGAHRFAAVWTRPDGSRGGVVVVLPPGVRPGTDYLVRPRPDGGAVVAEGLWDDTHAGVGLFRFGAAGALRSFSLLPEPSTQQAARSSTVRFLPPGQVLVAYARRAGVTIARFEVR